MRRYGEAIERGRRYRRRPGAYAILIRDGAVLLTAQAGEDGGVQLPGGGLDPGEGPLAALRREVLEETGWTIAAPRRLGAYRRWKFMPDYDLWAEKLCEVWLARPALRLGPPRERGHAAFWAAPDVALGLLESPGDRAFLAALTAAGGAPRGGRKGSSAR